MNNTFENVPLLYQEKLKECIGMLRTFALFEQIWLFVLTKDQKDLLGNDIDEAYDEYGGTIGIWQKFFNSENVYAVAINASHASGLIGDNVASNLLEAVGGTATFANNTCTDSTNTTRPVWNRDQQKLMFQGEVIRNIRTYRERSNIERIVDAFEYRRWPERIKSPSDYDASKVRDSIRSLNGGLRQIKFHSQSGGEYISWQPV